MEDKKFVLRISPELKEKAEANAKKQNRSLNGYLLNLIQNEVEDRILITGKDLDVVLNRGKR